MELILLVIACVLLSLNLLISIGIAGSVVKLVTYNEEEGVLPPRRESTTLELPDREPFYDGMAPLPPNSDGAGGAIED